MFIAPPHLEYVATLPCNLLLITCCLTLMFHRVVCQYMQGVMGFLITRKPLYCKFTIESSGENMLKIG